MATFIPLTNLPTQVTNDDDTLLVGGSFEFFLAGTTTATEIFSDSSGTSIGTSITLNSFGFPESGGNTITLFRDQSKALKVVLKNPAGTTIYTADNIPAVASFDTTASDKLDGIDSDADATNATTVAAAGALMQDGSTSMSGDLAMDSATFIKVSVSRGLVASTTQTQGEGVLIGQMNEVATVANNNDVRTMMAAESGMFVFVFNNGLNTLQLYPKSGEKFNTLAVDASTTLTSTSNAIFACHVDGTWELT